MDQYFEVAFENYRTTLGDVRLHQAVFEERRVTDAGNETRQQTIDARLAELKVNAVINWHDEVQRKLYEEAVEE